MKKVILIFLIILSFSCEKDSSNRNPIYTGIVNENMYHASFNEGFYLTYIWNECGYGDCMDSIDLFNDGEFDLLLKARFLNYELFESPECCPPPLDCWPVGIKYNISSLNIVEIATYYEPFEDIFFLFADTLIEGYRIDTIENWNIRTDLWCDDYPYPHKGAWYFIQEDRYLAIRTGDSMGDSIHYNYGWIKVGTDSDHNLVFKEYALEQ